MCFNQSLDDRTSGGRGLCLIANGGQMDVIGFGTDIGVTRFADGTTERTADGA